MEALISQLIPTVDKALAAALCGEELDRALIDAADGLVVERIHYHGVAGLLVGPGDRPSPIQAAVRNESIARAMWELRHRQQLAPILEDLHQLKVPALLLKGTAIAYGLYEEPATRIRGDTDLWIEACQLCETRKVLAQRGFVKVEDPDAVAGLQLEEAWRFQARDGIEHLIDLHWSAVNSAALRNLLDFRSCWDRRRALPRLAIGAFSLGHCDALLHAAVHRQMHVTSPYLVDGSTFYGGDRLIWIKDLDLLARALQDSGLE